MTTHTIQKSERWRMLLEQVVDEQLPNEKEALLSWLRKEREERPL